MANRPRGDLEKEVGLWIDHRRAVIVINLDQEEEIKRITSRMEKHVRYSGASHASSATNHIMTHRGQTDRRFDNQLSQYYDEVISYLRVATSILILPARKKSS
jgi:hypothetical protein